MSAINTLKVLSIAIIPNLQWRRIVDAMAVVFNLWRAVKSAKNIVHDNIPSSLTLGGIAVHPGDVANSFAKHFHSKVNNFVNATQVNRNVYNGKNKLIVPNRNFMQKSDVKECLNLLPNKKCEGFDRIPVCILKDSKTLLLDPLTELFKPCPEYRNKSLLFKP